MADGMTNIKSLKKPVCKRVKTQNANRGLCPECGKPITKGRKLTEDSIRMCKEYHEWEVQDKWQTQ